MREIFFLILTIRTINQSALDCNLIFSVFGRAQTLFLSLCVNLMFPQRQVSVTLDVWLDHSRHVGVTLA